MLELYAEGQQLYAEDGMLFKQIMMVSRLLDFSRVPSPFCFFFVALTKLPIILLFNFPVFLRYLAYSFFAFSVSFFLCYST